MKNQNQKKNQKYQQRIKVLKKQLENYKKSVKTLNSKLDNKKSEKVPNKYLELNETLQDSDKNLKALNKQVENLQMQIYQDEKEINELIVKINYYNNIGTNSTKRKRKIKKENR